MNFPLQQLLKSWIFVCVLAAVSGEKMILAEKSQCGGNNTDGGDPQCSICVVKSNAPHKQGQVLLDYVHSGNIVFNDSGTNYLSWNYDDFTVSDPFNITVSFNIWDGDKQMGRALRGCCGVPLYSGGCWIQDCVSGLTFVTVEYQQWTAAKAFPMGSMRYCSAESERPSVRYFHICVHNLTTWSERYNCECAVYDSVTGNLEPGNHTSELGINETEAGVWYFEEEPRSYQVCIFSMPKDDVMARGALADSSDVMDPVAFNRGVFYMRNFSGINGSVIDNLKDRIVDCTIRSFTGAELFNISSLDLDVSMRSSNNQTFTCLAPWPNGTLDFRPQGTHVKCMPQNETFLMSHVYAMKKKTSNNSFVSTMAVFIPLLGAIAVMTLICIFGLALRKKFNKFMKDMKAVPEELDTVMKESFDNYASKVYDEKEEKEHCQAFDREEKDRIFSLRHKDEERNEAYATSRRNFMNDPFRHQNGSDPKILNATDLHSKMDNIQCLNELSGNVTRNQCVMVVCHQYNNKSHSFNQIVRENDSGCQLSISSGQTLLSDDGRSSVDASYMLRHVPDADSEKNQTLITNLSTQNPKSASMIVDDPPCDGYWSKQSFRKLRFPDTISRCSNDTGCGTDIGIEDDSSVSVINEEETKKHPFIKTTSKDSGVVTGETYRDSLRDSMSDISDDIIDDDFNGYSPKTFEMSYPEHIIVSCIRNQSAAY